MNANASADLNDLHASAAMHCRNITRAHARNFYYGLQLLPEPQRSAMFAVYAWMRRADDLGDAHRLNAADDLLARVESFRLATDEAIAGQSANGDLMWMALADAARRFHFDAEHFHAVLQGQIDDLRRRRYECFDDVCEYCKRVASAVGLICIRIWGCEVVAARQLAVDRGIAFQLTNIVRDFAEDFDVGRLYLPQEDFHRFELTPLQLRHWSKPIASHAMMVRQIERAKSYYDRSAGLEGLLRPEFRPTLWAMTHVYYGLLHEMRRNPSRIVLGNRLRLNSLRKGTIALRARLGAASAKP